MGETILNIIQLRHPPETEWKKYVREILLEVYGNQLRYYTAKGSGGTPRIATQLLKGLHRKSLLIPYDNKRFFFNQFLSFYSILEKINSGRTAANFVSQTMLVRNINVAASNKRSYKKRKLNSN